MGNSASLLGLAVIFIGPLASGVAAADDAQVQVLFDGTDLEAWEFDEGSWVIEDGALTCRMQQTTDRNGRPVQRGRGNIWTKDSYDDFELTLAYKLSEAANSGVFYRADKNNPVQGGFEVQLMDNQGFQKSHGQRDGRKLNGAFYDAKAPSSDPSKPAGQWNHLRLRCEGPRVQIAVNGVQVIDVDVEDWDTPQMNPDGTPNKFKTALKDLPRTGRIGLQNHGQVVWFKDIQIKPLQASN